MLARVWQGRATAANADACQRHFKSEVTRHLRNVDGFRGALLLRKQNGNEVTFTSITFFIDMDAVRSFAGEHPELAVVEETARCVLTSWDEHVVHHEVAVDITA